MENRAGSVTKRKKKIAVKLYEEESKHNRTKTLLFDWACHLVHLNLSYIIDLKDKPYKNKEEIRNQLNLNKAWRFDVKKITIKAFVVTPKMTKNSIILRGGYDKGYKIFL